MAVVLVTGMSGTGKSAALAQLARRDRILSDLAKAEPLLRAGATAEIDTRTPLDDVVDALESIADTVRRRSE